MDIDKLDFNVSHYTKEDLYEILGFEPGEIPTEQQITNSVNEKISIHTNPEIKNFFNQITNRLIRGEGKLGETSDMWQTEYSTPKQNKKNNALDHRTNRYQQVHVNDDEDENFVMFRNKLNVGTTHQTPLLQGAINPNMKNIISRRVNIDSQYRKQLFSQNINSLGKFSYLTSSTDFSLEFSEHLTNVLSLKLHTITLPPTWNVFSKSRGNTCMEITNKDYPDEKTFISDQIFNVIQTTGDTIRLPEEMLGPYYPQPPIILPKEIIDYIQSDDDSRTPANWTAFFVGANNSNYFMITYKIRDDVTPTDSSSNPVTPQPPPQPAKETFVLLIMSKYYRAKLIRSKVQVPQGDTPSANSNVWHIPNWCDSSSLPPTPPGGPPPIDCRKSQALYPFAVTALQGGEMGLMTVAPRYPKVYGIDQRIIISAGTDNPKNSPNDFYSHPEILEYLPMYRCIYDGTPEDIKTLQDWLNIRYGIILNFILDEKTEICTIENLTEINLRIYFYRPQGFTEDKNLVNCGKGKNPAFINHNLGWKLGFRIKPDDKTGEVYLDIDKNGSAISPARVDIKGPKYFTLSIDDFNQNHSNKGLINILEIDETVSLPSYYNPNEDDILKTNLNNEREIEHSEEGLIHNEALKSIECTELYNEKNAKIPYVRKNVNKPRTLTAAQIYSINEIISNRNKVRTRIPAPSVSNTFSHIPLKKINTLRDNHELFIHHGTENDTRTYFGPVHIRKMRVTLFDDQGNIVDLNGEDWSCTIDAEILYQY